MNGTEVAAQPTTSFGFTRYSSIPCEQSPVQKNNAYYYMLESESSQGSDDGSESVLSVQGKETDLVKDTSDSAWSSDDNSILTELEYEVVSSNEERLSDLQSQVIDGDGSSDSDDNLFTSTIYGLAMLNDGDFVFADSEESMNTSNDTEQHLYGYSKCIQCLNPNSNPQYRYCEKCYKVRKEFFPPRPKPKRPKATKDKEKVESKYKNGVKSLLNAIPSNKSTIISPPKLDFQNIFVPKNLDFPKSSNEPSTSETSSNFANISSQSYDSTISESDSKKASNINVFRECRSRKRVIDSDDGLDIKRMKKSVSDSTLIETCSVRKNTLISKSFDAEPISINVPVNSACINDAISFSQPSFSSTLEPLSKSFSDPAITFSKDDIDLNSQVYSDMDISVGRNDSIPKKLQPTKRGSESDMCITCLVEPKSGVFVHGRIAHICCCYKCSVKVWVKTKRCPICNCKVSNVLKAFVM